MGSSTWRVARPAKNARQSTPTPWTCRSASAVVSVATSARSLRSTGTAVTSASAAIAVRTPSGPTSRNVVTPRRVSSVSESANRTASRTCRTQCSGSVTSPSIGMRGVE